jgi:hypothetical protein
MTKGCRYETIYINTAGPKYANQDNVNRNVHMYTRQLPVEKTIKWGYRHQKYVGVIRHTTFCVLGKEYITGVQISHFNIGLGKISKFLSSDIRRTPYRSYPIFDIIEFHFKCVHVRKHRHGGRDTDNDREMVMDIQIPVYGLCSLQSDQKSRVSYRVLTHELASNILERLAECIF